MIRTVIASCSFPKSCKASSTTSSRDEQDITGSESEANDCFSSPGCKQHGGYSQLLHALASAPVERVRLLIVQFQQHISKHRNQHQHQHAQHDQQRSQQHQLQQDTATSGPSTDQDTQQQDPSDLTTSSIANAGEFAARHTSLSKSPTPAGGASSLHEPEFGHAEYSAHVDAQTSRAGQLRDLDSLSTIRQRSSPTLHKGHGADVSEIFVSKNRGSTSRKLQQQASTQLPQAASQVPYNLTTRPAYQSSDYNGGHLAYYALTVAQDDRDGYIDGKCAHTLNEQEPWW